MCTSINCSHHLHCQWVLVDWCCCQELFAEVLAQNSVSPFCCNVVLLGLALVVQGWSRLYCCISPLQLLILREVANRTLPQHLLILFATTSLCVAAHA